MADYKFLPIDKNAVPYLFSIQLDGRSFTIHVNYNALYDFFTVDLYRDEELITAGEKIVYGRPLFCYQRHLDIPHIPIIPYDLSMQETRVGWENMGSTVFLWIPGNISSEGVEAINAELLDQADGSVGRR